MAEFKLLAEPGRPTGSRPARRLRVEGRVPAIVYGPGVDPVAVTVNARDLRSALTTEAGVNAVLSLRVDGKSYLTMARELQRHPVRGNVIHVDFQVVDPNREVSAEVQITLVGEATDLNRSDGVLDQQMFALSVFARPADIPPSLEVDISEVAIGSSIRVSEISLPEGVRTEVDLESVVLAGQPPRVVVEEAPEVEGEEVEGAEGEAAASAERGETSEGTSESGSEEG